MEIQITNKNDQLGRGAYSIVFAGTYKGKNVAVKRILLPVAVDDNEVKVMQQILDHPNVVKLLHVENDEDFRFIALELCVASLDKIFPKPEDSRKYEGPELPNNLEIFSQLASGLEYIHSKKLIHRDIKPANVLISIDDQKVVTMKLADFGLSKSVNERGTCSMNSGVKGTYKWLAPELLKSIANEEPQQGRGTVKSDVFALGLVFGYLLLDGQHLYGSNENEINANIVANTQVNINKIHPFHYALELIKNMLKHDDRISSDKVVIQLKSIKQKLAVKEQELRHLCTNSTSLDFEKFEILTQLAIDAQGKSIGGWNELDKAFQVILDQLVEETKKFENDPNYPSNYRRKMADTWNNFIYTISNFPPTFQDKVVQQMIRRAAEATKDSTLASMSFDQSFGNHFELTNSDNSEDKEVIIRQGEERQVKGNSTMASSEPNINLHIPQEILDKICAYYKNATDKLLNILIFFSKERSATERTIQILRSVLDNDKAFQGMVDSLVEDPEKLKNDENYYSLMAAIWNNLIKPNIEYVVGCVQRINFRSIVTNMNLTEASATYNFIATLSRFPQAAQKEIVELIMNAAQQVAVYPTSLELLNQSFNNLLKVTTSSYGNAISVGLLAVFLTYDIWNNVKQWWNGQITGEQCAKNIINSFAGVAGGVAGGYVGAKVGSGIAPGVGTVVGAVVGGVIGSALSSSLSQWLTEYFFKSPKEKTLEDAYKFLNLNSDASIDAINDSFRRLAKEYSPYIVGSNDNFEKLQYFMSIIKLHKGD